MQLRNELSRIGLLAFLPVVLVQGHGVRRRVQRLPEATSTSGRVDGRGEVLQVVVLGDSVAAGVGVGDHSEAMAGRLAQRLHASSDRPVAWEVVARSGADATEAAAMVERVRSLGAAEVVVISVGVNDVKNLRSDQTYRDGLRALLEGVVTRAPAARVFVLGMPPVERFPALPQPLAHLLGARARRLDRIGSAVAAEFATVARVEFTAEALHAVQAPFADDGFHPGPEVHDRLAAEIAARLAR